MTAGDSEIAFRRAPGVVHRWFQGTILALPAEGEASRLTGAAAVIFAILATPAPASELTSRVQDTLGLADPPTPASIDEAIDLLLASGLVQEAAP